MQLEKLGVTVWTGVAVTGIDAGGLWIGSERIHAHTVIWAAGVAASPLAKTLGVPLDRAGRVIVEPELTIPGHDDVYVIGDLAHVANEGGLVPGVAPAAMQAGQHAAQNIMQHSAASLACRSGTPIRACWPQSAGAPPLPGSGRSKPLVSSPGCSGCSCIFSF